MTIDGHPEFSSAGGAFKGLVPLEKKLVHYRCPFKKRQAEMSAHRVIKVFQSRRQHLKQFPDIAKVVVGLSGGDELLDDRNDLY